MNTALTTRRWFDSFLAWYFVTIWGSGFLASKIGMQYAAPFTFLTVRFLFGIACMVPIVLVMRPLWPASRAELGHVIVAGLLMHAIHLGGSHYTQYLGVSAGITAVLLTVQPLLTALVASRWMGEQLSSRQWLGIGVGFAGVVLVVWHKIDIREMTLGSLCAVIVALLAVTAGTLYQRVFCARVDLRACTLVQFVATAAVLAPLAWFVEGFRITWAWPLVRRHRIPRHRRVDTRGQRAAHADAPRRSHARDQPLLPDAGVRGGARIRAVPGRADDGLDARHRDYLRGSCAGGVEARSAGAGVVADREFQSAVATLTLTSFNAAGRPPA